jgi:histidine triad (HIT) family protein
LPERDPDCLFCSIIAGERPAEIVFEDEISIAFLDVRPVFHGHSLLVPRDHYKTLADLPGELLEPYFANVQLLSRAIPAAMEAQGSFVAINNVVSQSVPHLHTHIVPRVRKDGLRGFFWPRTKYEHDDHASETAAKIRAAVAELAATG